MTVSINNILSNEDINYLLNMPQVLNAKNNIDKKTKGSEYFSIPLTESIKSITNLIYEKMGLDLSNVDSIPMRWIKGDTQPHIDKGSNNFKNTYLIYLTESSGKLVVNNESFPIHQNYGYIFNEGLDHKTINTGFEPRLLLGPMSEKAFAVGAAITISAPGGTTVNIKYTELNGLEYTYDNTNWNGISFPITIQNTNTSAGFLKIVFITDISLYADISYFICTTDKIQFGSESLNNDGSRPIITIDNVLNYPGLIQNFNSVNGFSNINIFNLDIRSVDSTIANLAGWIGGDSFGTNATNNYIINCSSNGVMFDYCGGIVGSGAAGTDGSLTIIGCSSSGTIIGNGAGGIVGDTAGLNGGTITINSCWSTGNIMGDDAGGIIGNSAGANATTTITNCYSSGAISGSSAGGICGSDTAINEGIVNINNSYSSGIINGYKSGGIIGEVDNTSPRNIGTVTVSNCYTTGNANTTNAAGGITGKFTNSPNVTLTHCYTSGTVTEDYGYFIGDSVTDIIATCYSEAYHAGSGWTTSNANTVLTGVPTSGYVGTTWISNTGNYDPYELLNMGYNPYSVNIISGSPPNLVRTYDFTINKGSSTNSAIKDSFYALLAINNNDPNLVPTIGIDNSTGEITTTSETAINTYTIIVYSLGSYNITQVNLTVNDSPLPCLTEDTNVLTPDGYIKVTNLRKGDNVITSDNKVVEIINIFKSHVIGNNLTYPCIISKNSIGYNYPSDTFKISQNHLIKYNEKWIYPKLHFPLDKSMKTIKYYHIKLENYITDHLVINNGIVVESLGNHPSDICNEEYKKEHQRRIKNMHLYRKLH